jgi:hypothetical protein
MLDTNTVNKRTSLPRTNSCATWCSKFHNTRIFGCSLLGPRQKIWSRQKNYVYIYI